MTCHQHRCCRRPTSVAAPVAPTPTAPAPADAADYVLLATQAGGSSVLEAAITALRGLGASPERHDLGLRLNCRETNWRGALGHLCAALAATARLSLRVVRVPVGADALTFHRALLTAEPLDAFAEAISAPAAADSHLLGDVFKGESLE